MAYFRKIDLQLLESPAQDLLNLLLDVDGSGSGLDADKLDGLHASDLVQIISSNTTKTVYGAGADFANLRDAFNWLKNYYILPGVTVTFSIPAGTWDVSADLGLVIKCPLNGGNVVITGADYTNTILEGDFASGYFIIFYCGDVTLKKLTLRNTNGLSTTATCIRTYGPSVWTNENVVFDGWYRAMNINDHSLIRLTTMVDVVNAINYGFLCTQLSTLYCAGISDMNIGFAPGATGNAAFYAQYLSAIQLGYNMNLTISGTCNYGVFANHLSRVSAYLVDVAGASQYQFYLSNQSSVMNNGGSGDANIAFNTLSADGSFISR